MLSSMLKNPEGVTAIGNAATDITKAATNPLAGGSMDKATKINIMVIIGFVLTIAFIILMILTIIFFFKWMVVGAGVTGLLAKLVSKINDKAGAEIDSYKKKNKTGALVCGILGLCCLIGNVALTTFIK